MCIRDRACIFRTHASDGPYSWTGWSGNSNNMGFWQGVLRQGNQRSACPSSVTCKYCTGKICHCLHLECFAHGSAFCMCTSGRPLGSFGWLEQRTYVEKFKDLFSKFTSDNTSLSCYLSYNVYQQGLSSACRGYYPANDFYAVPFSWSAINNTLFPLGNSWSDQWSFRTFQSEAGNNKLRDPRAHNNSGNRRHSCLVAVCRSALTYLRGEKV